MEVVNPLGRVPELEADYSILASCKCSGGTTVYSSGQSGNGCGCNVSETQTRVYAG